MTYHMLVDIIDGRLVLNEATFAVTYNRQVSYREELPSGMPVTVRSGETGHVYIFLLDTQGLFLNDCDGFISESIMIFTMLISEVLIFNLFHRPDGDDLRTIYRAVEISSNLVNRRPINNLLFLIRDAMLPDASADELLQSIWEQTENSKELTEACTVIRQNILNIGCVLMCAPSKNVREANHSVGLTDSDDRKFLDGILKVGSYIEKCADGSLMEKLELSFWKETLERIDADLPKLVRGIETTKPECIQRTATKIINKFDLHCSGTTAESVSQFYLTALEDIKLATSQRSLEVNHTELIAEIAKRLQVLHDNDMSNLRSIGDAEEFWRSNGIAKEAGSDAKTYDELKERLSARIRHELLPNHIRDLIDKREPTLQSLVQKRTRIAELEESKFIAIAVENEISFLKADVKKLEPMYVCSPRELLEIISTATPKVEKCFERVIMKRKNELMKLEALESPNAKIHERPFSYAAAAAKNQSHQEARIEGTARNAGLGKQLIRGAAFVSGADTQPEIPSRNAANSEKGLVASKKASHEKAATGNKSGTRAMSSSVALVPMSVISGMGTAPYSVGLEPFVTSGNQMLLNTENMMNQLGIRANSNTSSGARSDQETIVNKQQIQQASAKASQSSSTAYDRHQVEGLKDETKQPNQTTIDVKGNYNYKLVNTDYTASEQRAEIALLTSKLAKLQEEKASLDSKHGKCYVEIRDLKVTCTQYDEIHKNLLGFRHELRELVRENRKYDFLIREVRDELLRIEMERCLDRDYVHRGEPIYKKLHEQRGHVAAHSYELATDGTFKPQRIFFEPLVNRDASKNSAQYPLIDNSYDTCFREIENALHLDSMNCRAVAKAWVVEFQNWLMGWRFPFFIELSICFSFQINAEELLRKFGKGMPYAEDETATKNYRQFIDLFTERPPKDHLLPGALYRFCEQEMENIVSGYPDRYPMAVAAKLSREFCRRAWKDCSRQLPEKAAWMWDFISCVFIYKWAARIQQFSCKVEKEKPPRGRPYFLDMINYVTMDMSSKTGDKWKAQLIQILEGRQSDKAVKNLQDKIQSWHVALSHG
ncbi:unnamed protein product, partial [Mesorhabditis spiculigera]